MAATLRSRRQTAAAGLQAAIRSLENEPHLLGLCPEVADLWESLIAARDLLVAPVLSVAQRKADREAARFARVFPLGDQLISCEGEGEGLQA